MFPAHFSAVRPYLLLSDSAKAEVVNALHPEKTYPNTTGPNVCNLDLSICDVLTLFLT